jgi:catechol 2,3-dioxygenase-like lactoylglutathione lyase family enzyme
MIKDGQTAATLAVTDIDRARKFYTDTLGFPIIQENPGGILFQSGKGTAFFVYPSEFAGTNKATAVSINVDDFDATIADLRNKGISFMDFEYPEFKTENGIAQTPDGPAAWFTDPDGNIIAVAQMPAMP